jgi:protein-S-isoprenylcysteine O-methyltransferase Ste14
MTWLRGFIFTILVPCVIGVYVPHVLARGRGLQGGWWQLGWYAVTTGAAVYAICLVDFLRSGGTPAIFFTRPLKFLLGEEPPQLVRNGLYKVSRNPMYLGVVTAVFGQALLYASWQVAAYGAALCVIFHLVVVLIEEPHLRKVRGAAFGEYCSHVPRWLGLPR